jgi:outer membrane protein
MQIKSLEMTKKLNERQAGFTFSVGLQLGEQWSPSRTENRVLSLLISYPLFDAGRSRAVARETALNIDANLQDLLQAERTARAEIESAYRELLQNRERLDAAKAALQAAEINYAAAVESQRLGAASVVEVSLARVSLITAQSEAIQATYDYAISNSRLQLVTGRPLPGE